MNSGLIFGLVLIVAIIAFAGYMGGRQTKGEKDFLLGGANAGPVFVMASLMGGAIGSGATVGSTQTAFQYGMTGAWQNIGAAFSFIIMAIVLPKYFLRLRDEEGVVTLSQALAHRYGRWMGIVTACTGVFAVLISLVSQIKGSVSLMMGFVDIPLVPGILITCVIIFTYLGFGGILSTRIGGFIKTILTYTMMLSSFLLALKLFGQMGVNMNDLITEAFGDWPWRSMFSRGAQTTANAAIPTFFSQMCAQSYLSAVFMARNPKAFQKGAVISCILALPLGFFASYIGMYMRVAHPDIDSAVALSTFLTTYFPPVISGIFLGVSFLVVVATASGHLMGVSTNVVRDVYYQVARNKPSDKRMLLLVRLTIIASLVICCIFAYTEAATLIQNLVSLSLAMRVNATFIPILFMVYRTKGVVTNEAGVASAVAGPLSAVIWKWVFNEPFGIASIFVGVGCALVAWLVANAIYKNNPKYQIQTTDK